MHTPGAQIQNPCTRQPKCAHRVQGAHLISNTDRYSYFAQGSSGGGGGGVLISLPGKIGLTAEKRYLEVVRKTTLKICPDVKPPQIKKAHKKTNHVAAFGSRLSRS